VELIGRKVFVAADDPGTHKAHKVKYGAGSFVNVRPAPGGGHCHHRSDPVEQFVRETAMNPNLKPGTTTAVLRIKNNSGLVPAARRLAFPLTLDFQSSPFPHGQALQNEISL
jgi:hypothetical protein